MEPNECLLSKEPYSDGVDRVKIVRSWNTAAIVLFFLTLLALGSLIYLFYVRSKLSKDEALKYWKGREKTKEASEVNLKTDETRKQTQSSSRRDNTESDWSKSKPKETKRKTYHSDNGKRAYELYKKY